MDRSTYYGDGGWRCPECGKVNKSTARFCTGCGAPVTAAAAGDGYDQDSYAGSRDTGYYDQTVVDRNTGYYDQTVVDRNTGYYDRGAYDAYAAEPEEKSGGALKTIAIILACLLVAGAAGFAVYRFVLSKDDNTANQSTPPQQSAQAEDEDTAGEDPGEPDSTPAVVEEDDEDDDDDSYFKPGNTYTVVAHDGVRVRSTPSVQDDNQLDRSQLVEYYNQSHEGPKACLKQGTRVTCISMEGNWMEISDGWICVYYDGEDLVR